MLLCSRIKQENLLHKPLPMSIILIIINSHPRFSSRTLVTMMFFDSLALKMDFLPNVSFNLWSLVFAFSYIGVQVKSYSLGRLQAVSCNTSFDFDLDTFYLMFVSIVMLWGGVTKADILRSGWPKGGGGVSHLGPDRKHMWKFWSIFFNGIWLYDTQNTFISSWGVSKMHFYCL